MNSSNETPTKNKFKQWLTDNLSILLSLALVVVMLLTVVSPLGLFTAHDAPFQVLAACLGAIVTVLITSLLLKSQAKQQQDLQAKQAKNQQELQSHAKQMELKQIKETEQYKTKLRIYQEYLVSLYEAVKDRNLTTDEKIKMQFQTAYLTMHSESGHIEEVSKSVKDIFDCLMTRSENYNVKTLQSALFNIIIQFREELYEIKNVNDDVYEPIINNFVEAYTPEGDDSNPEGNTNSEKYSTITIWQDAVKKWEKDEKWKLMIDGEMIRLHRPDNVDIHVQFGFWEGHYYIEAKYHNSTAFSKSLKWKYKGRRTYETWWKYLPSPFFDLKKDIFWEEFSKNEKMQKELVDWFELLMNFINNWDVPVNRFNELMNQIDRKVYEQKGWKFWIYDYYDASLCVVCDLNNKDYGNPFIDIFPETEKIVIRFGNRNNDIEAQKKILARIGISEENIRKEDGRTDYAVFENVTLDNIIMAKAAELLEKLSQL